MATARTTTADITEIQRQMAQVRRELHQEAQHVVKGAQSLTDWRSHVRHHPWLALGAAAAVGYLIVPRRRQEPVPTIVAVAPQAASALAPARAAGEPKKKRWGLIGSAVGLLAPIAIRAVQNYAIQYLEQWIAAQPPGGGASLFGSGLIPGASPPDGGVGGRPGARPSPPPGGTFRPRDAR